MVKQITFASSLRPDWKTGRNTKENSKKSAFVTISAGGLDDSDVQDVNLFRLEVPPSKSRTHALSEEEVTEGAQKAKRDLSRQNEVTSLL